jgi:hypothetical protein
LITTGIMTARKKWSVEVNIKNWRISENKNRDISFCRDMEMKFRSVKFQFALGNCRIDNTLF